MGSDQDAQRYIRLGPQNLLSGHLVQLSAWQKTSFASSLNLVFQRAFILLLCTVMLCLPEAL